MQTDSPSPMTGRCWRIIWGVDRSAMSAELSRMKKDGLIDFKRNEFEILTSAQDMQIAQKHPS